MCQNVAVTYTLIALTNFHVQQKLVILEYLGISTGTKDGSYAKADFWLNNKTAREAQIYLINKFCPCKCLSHSWMLISVRS